MNALYTVAYPELRPEDAAIVEAIRARHDRRSVSRIRPHVTLLFACDAVPLAAYLAHVETVAERTRSIAIRCRRVALDDDPRGGMAYVFLVIEGDGAAAIASLHDALYAGPMTPCRRHDPAYVPHITVGSALARQEAQTLCEAWNRTGVDIAGRVSTVHVGEIVDDRFRHHGAFALGA